MATILILGDPTWPGPSWPWSCAGHPRTTRWGRIDIANVQERWLRSTAKFSGKVATSDAAADRPMPRGRQMNSADCRRSWR